MRAEVNRPEIASLPDLLHLLWRRRWVILPAVVLVPVAALVVSLLQQSRYEATADVLLSRQDLAASLTGLGGSEGGEPTRFVRTQAEVARTPIVAERTVESADVTGLSAEELLENSKVTASEEIDMLVFEVTEDSAATAVALASAYAEEYVRYREELDALALRRAQTRVDEQLASLEAAGEGDSPLARSLRENAQQLQALAVLQGSNSALVRPATGATQVEPHPRRNTLLGLVVGLAIGLGLAFLRELFDTRLRSEDEISDALDLPLLSRIPEPPRRFRSGSRLVTLGEPFGADAEPYRILRTNLEIANLAQGARSIMITSTVEGENTSMVAANLAVTLARAGRSLVLADLDLRSPALARYFELERAPGLVEVALGDLPLDEAIRPVPIGGPEWGGSNGSSTHARTGVTLDVLPAGVAARTASTPGALVGTPALKGILASLEEQRDLVLATAAPLLPAGDALALSTHVDAVILVCHLKVLRRSMLPELRRLLASCPAAKLGFVLVGVELEASYKLVTVRGKSHPQRVP